MVNTDQNLLNVDIIGRLKTLLSSPRIIEKGTSGNYHYQKWSDDTVEAWATINYGVVTPTIWANNIYYKDQTVDIPSGLFDYAPTYASATGANSQWTCVGIRGLTNTNFIARFIKPASSNQTLVFYVYLRS